MTTKTEESAASSPVARTTPPAAPELAALIESGRIAQLIVDHVQEGVMVLDRELRYRFWNPFMEKVTGQQAAEVMGRYAPDVHPFLKESGLQVLLERTLAGRASSATDIPYAQKRSNWSGYLSASLTPLRGAGEAVVGVIVLLHDTTRRKRQEEAAAAQESRYRPLFEENPQPMWVHDVETLAFLAVNDAALRHYGWTREEFLFMTLNDVLAPADMVSAPRQRGAFQGLVDETHLWRHRLKDGKIIDVEVYSHVVSFAGRRAVLMLANDVSERLKAQQRLREDELKYRTLIEAADVAIFLVDGQTGRILEANRRAESLLGLPRHQIVGLLQEDLSPPELVAAARRAAPQQELPYPGATRLAYVWHRAGRRIPVDIISSMMELGGRRVVQSMYRDITERWRTEESLARRTRQLEVLARANRQINAVLQVAAVQRTLVAAAQEMIQAGGGMAGLRVGQEMVFSEYWSNGQGRAVNYCFKPGQGVAGYVLATKLIYCSNDAAQDPLVLPELQCAFDLHNLVNVPILNRTGELLGCLEVHNTEHELPIEDSDLTMLELLAAGAAVAIENTRTLALHAATLESVADGLLVVDLQGKMVSFNQRFVRMWHIPKEIVDSREDEQALACVLSQLKNPADFLAKVKQLYSTPEAESRDLLEFKDGRVFERNSSPQRVGTEVVGRVWSFRDVTAPAQAKPGRAKRRSARQTPGQ
jgi:PAS domain S-box-containing protein